MTSTPCFRNFFVALPSLVVAVSLTLSPNAVSADDSPPAKVQEMCDFLGEQSAYGCDLTVTMDIKSPDMNQEQEMAFQFRLERPSRMALIGDGNVNSMTIIKDDKTFSQSFSALKRYVETDVPAALDEFITDDAVKMSLMMLGPAGGAIPLGGQSYCDQMMAGVTESKSAGEEDVDGIACYRFDFKQVAFNWSLWIRKGDQPVPVKMVSDLSKQAGGGLPKGFSLTSTVSMNEWNLSPQWTEEDFQFIPPAGHQKMDSLFEQLESDGPDELHVLVGQPAPLFEVDDQYDESVRLEDVMKDNVVVLDFWATWCGPCVEALPKVAELTAKYADQGVRFLAINVGEDAETVGEFLAKHSLDIRVPLDEDGEISEAYSAAAIPQTVIIGKSGVVEVVHVGSSPGLEKKLAEEIDLLLTGKSLAEEALEKAKDDQQKRAEEVNEFGAREVWEKKGRFSGVAVNPADQSMVVSEADGNMTLFDRTGKKLDKFSVGTGATVRLANLVGDDQFEIVTFESWGSAVTARTMSGKTLWAYEIGQGVDDVWASDVNNDGYDEIIIGFNGSTGLHVLGHDGSLRWKNTELGNVWHVTAGDLDQDGEIEVISTSAQGQVHVFSAKGENINNFRVPLYANMVRTLIPTDSAHQPRILVTGTANNESEGMLSIDSQGKEMFSLSLPVLKTNHVDDMAIEHDVRLAAVAMRGGLVHVVNLDDGKLIATVAPQSLRCSVAWISGDEQSPQFVVATENKLITYELTP